MKGRNPSIAIAKRATGQFGKRIHIVESSDEAIHRMGCRTQQQAREALKSNKYVLTELVVGAKERSASMVVVFGKIIRNCVVEYTYDKEVYVWPRVKELKTERVCLDNELEPEHARVFETLLTPEFNGVCNFNYKVGLGGTLKIFECNVRCGGDLVQDSPKEITTAMLLALDGVQESAVLGGGSTGAGDRSAAAGGEGAAVEEAAGGVEGAASSAAAGEVEGEAVEKYD